MEFSHPPLTPPPSPGVDAAMEHGKCGITSFRIEAYLRAKSVQTLQRIGLAKLPPLLTLLTV